MGREAEQLQVKSHMHICMNVIPEADAMCTVAPSEPALVEAAAQLMNQIGSGCPVNVLANFLSNHSLSEGDHGELSCMLLMLLVHDKACDLDRQPSMKHPLMPYHKPLLVTKFLTTLFAAKYHWTILKALPPANGIPLEERFSTLHVHFTHFVKVTDYKVVK